jgi:hypothetical protein
VSFINSDILILDWCILLRVQRCFYLLLNSDIVAIKCQMFIFVWIVVSSHLKMSATEYANIKCCVLLHRSPSETLRMLEEACLKAVIRKPLVYELNKGFHDGRASVDDDPLCGRPSAWTNHGNIARVCNLVLSHRWKIIQ